MRIRILILLTAALHLSAVADDDSDSRRKLYLFFEGRDIYQTQCQPCHGRNGKGDGPWAADFTKNRPRNFRSGVFKFRTTPMGFLPTDDDLKRTIRSGISGTAMPTFKGKFSDEKLEAVIAYIKSFSRKWRNEEKHAKSIEIPVKPEWMEKENLRNKHIKAGQVLFTNHCAACHGPQGKGDGPAAAALKDIWEFDIRPADLSGEHHKSGDSPKDLYRTISLGLDGTPMVGFSGALKEEQIWNLIAFIKDLKKPSE